MSFNLLLVDDEPNILRMLSRLLARARPEWTVVTAPSAEDAVVILDTTTFDVIVSDMRMPGMDGAALLEQVIVRFPKTGRIILSGHAEVAERERALLVAHEFLPKPSTRDEVLACVERVAARVASSQRGA